MAVYYSDPRKDKYTNMKFCQGQYKKACADLPPVTDEIEKKKANEKSPQRKLFNELIDDFFDGGIDSDKILIGASLYFDQEAGFNILRDTIPYIHDKYDQSIISEKRDSLGITILEHSIDVDLKQDAAIRHLSVVFPQTSGILKLIAMPVADVYYWRYTFTLQTDKVLLDGEEVSLTSPIRYDVNIYFNRLYDSRANKH